MAKKHTMVTRIESELHERMKTAAQESYTSISGWTIQAILAFLPKPKSETQPKLTKAEQVKQMHERIVEAIRKYSSREAPLVSEQLAPHLDGISAVEIYLAALKGALKEYGVTTKGIGGQMIQTLQMWCD